MNTSQKLLNKISSNFGQIAVLIDPEKTKLESDIISLIKKAEFASISFFFVGGSTVSKKDIVHCVKILKQNTTIPVILFPGSYDQISEEADGILYLSLVSGRNPDFLITHHVLSALEIYESNLEVIPTGYILVDGGMKTSVEYVSQTTPIPREQIKIALKTALAAELQGKKIIYFDAGSGAKNIVPFEFIKELRKFSDIPIIVGGGIKSIEAIEQLKICKSNVIVIGNKIEDDANFLLDVSSISKKNWSNDAPV